MQSAKPVGKTISGGCRAFNKTYKIFSKRQFRLLKLLVSQASDTNVGVGVLGILHFLADKIHKSNHTVKPKIFVTVLFSLISRV